MDLRFGAHPHELAPLRLAIREWVMEHGGTGIDAEEVSLAVNEAATNTIEHAYRDEQSRELVVTASEHEGVVELRIRDFGHWREPRRRTGRGLTLVRALMDSVDVDSSGAGTEVLIRRRLHARAPLDSGGGGEP